MSLRAQVLSLSLCFPLPPSFPTLTSFPVLMQPLISDMMPRVNILNKIIRVLGSRT